MKFFAIALFGTALTLGGCSTTGAPPKTASTSADHPEARVYDASRNAKADVDAALLKAEAEGKLVLIAMGANWCHDSRAFAGWMETPRFEQLLTDKYELVYVNIGMPQTKDGHNLHIAEGFGVEIEGTPTVLVVSPIGQVLNADTATSWRNAASRSADEIYQELTAFSLPQAE